MTDTEISRIIAPILGRDVIFTTCRNPLPVESLTVGEKERLSAFKHMGRRDHWLRGRGALKALLRELGHSEDTSLLTFPHPCLSLTHAADLAVAGALREDNAKGFGIDYEASRTMRPGSERFFLDPGERERLWAGVPPSPERLLRLWTLKEALFKADEKNLGRGLVKYRLQDPMADSGFAQGPSGDEGAALFRYVSLEFESGFLSVAARAIAPS